MNSEERALIQAIRLDYRADSPRLAYADWLERHEFEDQAEFIRIACALDGNPNDLTLREKYDALLYPKGESSDDDVLIQREKGGGCAGFYWYKPLYQDGHVVNVGYAGSSLCNPYTRQPVGQPKTKLSFYKGLPEAITTTISTFACHATETLEVAPTLRSVVLYSGVPVNGRIIGAMRNFEVQILASRFQGSALSAVEELEYRSLGEYQGEGMHALLKSPELTGLTRLTSSYMKSFVHQKFLADLGEGDAIVRSLSENPNPPPLESLVLEGTRMTDEGAAILAKLPSAIHLRRLIVKEDPRQKFAPKEGLTDKGASLLASSPYLKNLRAAELGPAVTAQGYFEMIRKLPQLSETPLVPADLWFWQRKEAGRCLERNARNTPDRTDRLGRQEL